MPETRSQLKLIKDADVWHESIAAKLDWLAPNPDEDIRNHLNNFVRCGKDTVIRTCRACEDYQVHPYGCSIKWCPRCNWKLAKARQEKLKVWAAHVKQPKHIVTTQKNFGVITRQKITDHTANQQRLRDSKVFDQVQGGCTSVEITNGGDGWHLHGHTLVDARWVDAAQLAVRWGEIVGQEFAIVKVKDARGREYCAELTKYIAKGNQIAAWQPEQIYEFILAIRRKRFFFQFGNLSEMRDAVKAQLEFQKPERIRCECGACNFVFKTVPGV